MLVLILRVYCTVVFIRNAVSDLCCCLSHSPCSSPALQRVLTSSLLPVTVVRRVNKGWATNRKNNGPALRLIFSLSYSLIPKPKDGQYFQKLYYICSSYHKWPVSPCTRTTTVYLHIIILVRSRGLHINKTYQQLKTVRSHTWMARQVYDLIMSQQRYGTKYNLLNFASTVIPKFSKNNGCLWFFNIKS